METVILCSPNNVLEYLQAESLSVLLPKKICFFRHALSLFYAAKYKKRKYIGNSTDSYNNHALENLFLARSCLLGRYTAREYGVAFILGNILPLRFERIL